ncbi:hypothetical protein B0H16DRAFT_1750695 [Mycena metata]|uniref:RING-type domain-containing protein n=1 Tax=Mycena metata TaxID=1033252 RepID=A0AAD7DMV0_9AGAR|nr:hypothetical protein B0H16DRAFT_1750695 [Mycena metata]
MPSPRQPHAKNRNSPPVQMSAPCREGRSNPVRPPGIPNTLQNPILVDENGCIVSRLTPSPPRRPVGGRADENLPPSFPPPGARVVAVTVDREGAVLRRLLSYPSAYMRRSPSGHILEIFGGPPSAIRAPGPSVNRGAPSTRAAREAANAHPYLRALARVSHPPSAASSTEPLRHPHVAPAPLSANRFCIRRHVPNTGSRTSREPLTEDDLYLSDVRPPVLAESEVMRPHHQCAICSGVKSHPVAGPCGHTYCYVCLRRWLQLNWRCPYCWDVVTAAPIRNLNSEHAIAYDYPHWIDNSRLIPGNRDTLQEAARTRMQNLRVREPPTAEGEISDAKKRARASGAREHIRAMDAARRARLRDAVKVIKRDCKLRAKDQKQKRKAQEASAPEQRTKKANKGFLIHTSDGGVIRTPRANNGYLIRTPEANDGRLSRTAKENDRSLNCTPKTTQGTPKAKQRTPEANEGTPQFAWPGRRLHYDPDEVVTENQRRCRMLRRCRLEEDNGDDSDEELPPGMCGCNHPECQRMHKNKSRERKEWKCLHRESRGH